jgi:hypothetical protein
VRATAHRTDTVLPAAMSHHQINAVASRPESGTQPCERPEAQHNLQWRAVCSTWEGYQAGTCQPNVPAANRAACSQPGRQRWQHNGHAGEATPLFQRTASVTWGSLEDR